MRGIRLHSMIVPVHKEIGESAVLQCDYDLAGDTLYSVKWYKGKDEIFRYVPWGDRTKQAFPISGVHVDVSVLG